MQKYILSQKNIILLITWQYLSGESVLYLTPLTSKFKYSSFISITYILYSG